MADDTTPDVAERATDEPENPPEQPQRAEAPPEVKRALNRANKEAEQLRLKLKEYEDRDKSELEKLTEQRAEADKRAAAAELRAARLEVAADKGLTPAQAKYLTGASREELEAKADEILTDFPARPAEPDRPRRPRADPSQGSRGPSPSSGRDAALAEAQKRFGTKSTVT